MINKSYYFDDIYNEYLYSEEHAAINIIMSLMDKYPFIQSISVSELDTKKAFCIYVDSLKYPELEQLINEGYMNYPIIIKRIDKILPASK